MKITNSFSRNERRNRNMNLCDRERMYKETMDITENNNMNTIVNENMEIVKYLHSIEAKCTDNVKKCASDDNHLDIVTSLHSIGEKCTRDVMNHACEGGHLDVVKYLHSIGKKCTVAAMNLAARNGHLN